MPNPFEEINRDEEMDSPTPSDYYDRYVDALRLCNSGVYERTDDEIGDDLFEEFDLEATVCFYEGNLAILRNAGLIDDEMVEMSKEVLRQWRHLAETVARPVNIVEIKTGTQWRALFEFSDRLLERTRQWPNSARAN